MLCEGVKNAFVGRGYLLEQGGFLVGSFFCLFGSVTDVTKAGACKVLFSLYTEESVVERNNKGMEILC